MIRPPKRKLTMKKLLVWLIRAIARILRILPVRLRFLCGDLIGWIWFDLVKHRRTIVLDNLLKAYPEWSDEQRIRVGRKSVDHLGRGFIELLTIPALDRNNPEHKKEFRIEGREYFDAAERKGLGVCLLGLHLGNGDMNIAGLALHGIPVALISKLFNIKWLNDAWFEVRSNLGTEFIAPKNSAYHILKSLKQGKAVAFAQDQFKRPPVGVKTHFFGHETGTSMGLAVMAHRSKSPIIPVYTYREEDGTTVICFEPEIPFEEKASKDETIAHMTQVFTDKIEAIVRLMPEQWMWVHKRWKSFS